MTPPPSDDAWVQSSVTWQLLDFVQAPVHGEAVVRGVLPAPGGGSTLRVVTGERHAPLTALSAWEIPLTDGDHLLTGSATLGLVRAQLARVGQPLGPGVRDAGIGHGDAPVPDRPGTGGALRTDAGRQGAQRPADPAEPAARGPGGREATTDPGLPAAGAGPPPAVRAAGGAARGRRPGSRGSASSGPTTVLISLVDTYLREPERYGPDPVNDPHAATYVDLTGY